ncbi:hypothetical protein GQ44DRAFT_718323 [Phaeosphaeriaceae sp. PMI808]|nr:hypothetical protein GQ44DRAFT_718323 [Phaeosphaeriaceae sp. PMI808]
MPRKKPRFHSLKKLNVRQDWSRWSLYSIAQLRAPNVTTKTYFQQKWAAKASTRAYHGEQLREKKWKRQFKRNLPAVVPMEHKYLARYDGSEQAAGRGMGADVEETQRPPPMTPYMQMTYYPLERRLDTAIFRALFASSVRQARQFVVHGLVKVNGKKMSFPGYSLNPGDMFQVEPSSVITHPHELKKHLQTLVSQVDAVLAEDVKAKDKQKFRAFRQSIKQAIGLWRTANPETISTLDTQFDFLKTQIRERDAANEASSPSTTEPLISDEDQAKLRSAFEKLRLETEHMSVWNGRNSNAPYATPWRPRDYMSAFAFIPRYLEVNQNICAAVYLRHPVARPGLAEVPTPFHIETGQLAFNWYLRRR